LCLISPGILNIVSMEQQINFRTEKTPDDKVQFIGEEITITIDKFSYANGKHEIANPRTASAHFICEGKRYVVTNLDGVATIEDWYTEELLPKFQMLKLLIAEIQELENV
jgi:hypothetical protein